MSYLNRIQKLISCIKQKSKLQYILIFRTWQIVNLKKKKKKQVKPVKVVNCNINAANCKVLKMMQYVHCLRNINYQSTAICRQILPVDIEVEYFCDNIIYHHPTSVRIFL